MDYMILDSAGNALASFEDELTARATLHAIAAVDPEAREQVVLLAYDDDGMPVGDAVTVIDCDPPVSVEPSSFVFGLSTSALIRRVSSSQKRYVAPSAPVWRQQIPA
jgi:hypothetical protein